MTPLKKRIGRQVGVLLWAGLFTSFAVAETITVVKSGVGADNGAVTSVPAGIDCGNTCSAVFTSTQGIITLNPTPLNRFEGWIGCPVQLDEQCDITLSGSNVEITAVFRGEILNVQKQGVGADDGIVDSEPAGINCGSICEVEYEVGTTVVLSPSPQSKFVTWGSGNCTSFDPIDKSCTLTMNGDQYVQAVFQGDHRLTVNKTGAGAQQGIVNSTPFGSNPFGITCAAFGANECDTTFENDTVVTLTALPASQFTGWTDCLAVNGNVCTITMTTDTEVSAGFSALVGTLSVTINGNNGNELIVSSPSGISCTNPGPADCSEDYLQGIDVRLTNTGQEAAIKWDSGCDTIEGGDGNQSPSGNAGTCVVNINSASEPVVVTSVQRQYQFEIQMQGSGSGNIIAEGTVINCAPFCSTLGPTGTVFNLVAIPAEGSSFGGWTAAGAVCGVQEPPDPLKCTVVLTADQTLRPSFDDDSLLSSPIWKKLLPLLQSEEESN